MQLCNRSTADSIRHENRFLGRHWGRATSVPGATDFGEVASAAGYEMRKPQRGFAGAGLNAVRLEALVSGSHDPSMTGLSNSAASIGPPVPVGARARLVVRESARHAVMIGGIDLSQESPLDQRARNNVRQKNLAAIRSRGEVA